MHDVGGELQRPPFSLTLLPRTIGLLRLRDRAEGTELAVTRTKLGEIGARSGCGSRSLETYARCQKVTAVCTWRRVCGHRAKRRPRSKIHRRRSSRRRAPRSRRRGALRGAASTREAVRASRPVSANRCRESGSCSSGRSGRRFWFTHSIGAPSGLRGDVRREHRDVAIGFRLIAVLDDDVAVLEADASSDR